MIVTTTNTIEGKPIGDYLGVVSGEVIVGANMFRDIFASVRDIVGGRSNAYEEVLERARRDAILEMVGKARSLGGEAIVGCDIDYEVIGKAGSMLMVAISGTVVKLKK